MALGDRERDAWLPVTSELQSRKLMSVSPGGKALSRSMCSCISSEQLRRSTTSGNSGDITGSEVAQRALCRKGVLGAMAIEAERTLLIELAAITSSTGSSSQLLVLVSCASVLCLSSKGIIT